ncbi:hypothetical protein E2562_038697 [Oryza meyeriana var. granulata]|uniref:Uncharacterized protein n=1 Tax=Oryza meyeriana var. granulata TaxID=110450 RepID=A0A6G1CXR1_9ORYZ|nr:hypothetical protein E2562_038697 [Oryza meyeriana var. granulata]
MSDGGEEGRNGATEGWDGWLTLMAWMHMERTLGREGISFGAEFFWAWHFTEHVMCVPRETEEEDGCARGRLVGTHGGGGG